MIHAKFVLPRIFPFNSARQPEQIDRVQDIGGDLTLGREKEHEIGRVGVLGYREGTPAEAYTMKQYEFGDMKFWRALANKEDPISAGLDNSVNLDELKTTTFDIAAYLTDDDDTFRGTIWFPGLRVNGFSLNIADPDAIVERNFNLIGEDYKIIDENYLAYNEYPVGSGEEDADIVLSPIAINYASGGSPKYILRVLRIRGVECDVIEEGTDEDNTWSFVEGTQTLTVRTCEKDDLIKVYYVNETAPYTDLWTDHDEPSYTDFLTADSCEVFMKVGAAEPIYRLQSIGIDITFARTDYKEIGNDDIVLRGAKSQTVKISLNRFAEDITLERILAGNDNILIDPREFVNNIELMIKIYADKTKKDFKIGYLMKNISPTTLGVTQAVEDYMKKTNTLETDELLISDDENEIVFTGD